MKTRKVHKKPRPVLVRWTDSTMWSGWRQDLDDMPSARASCCLSRGYLVAENAYAVFVAATISIDGEGDILIPSDVMEIPRCSIKSIKRG